jgi:DNA-binding response OmpR family regulator
MKDEALNTLAGLMGQRKALEDQIKAHQLTIDNHYEKMAELDAQLKMTEGGIQTLEHLLSNNGEVEDDALTAQEAKEEEKPKEPQTAQERRAKEKAN